MEWTKIKCKHFLFSSLSDALLGQLARILCLVATLEKIPNDKELLKICTKKRRESLEFHYQSEGKSLEFVMQKVLEDVKTVEHKREISRGTSNRYNEKNKLVDASIDTTEKRREDKSIYKDARDVFNYWNLQDIVKHRDFDTYKKLILKTLKNNKLEELKQAIDNYVKILNGKNMWLTCKWPLKAFLTREQALPKFMPENFDYRQYTRKD